MLSKATGSLPTFLKEKLVTCKKMRQMENIFYAVLALHIAGKPVNKENVRAVLEVASTPVDEPALDAMAAFVESLESTRREKERVIDSRIIKFLTSELAQRKVQTKQIEGLLEELTIPISSASQILSDETRAPQAKTEVRQETVAEDSRLEMKVPVKGLGVVAEDKGRYVYGIAAGGNAVKLGSVGLEGNDVYTISYKGLCAIVHNCSTEPYQSSDSETVKNWVRTHQSVLDDAKERFGTVIPLGFDTILQPKDKDTSPDQVIKDWLKEDYDRLCGVMEKIKGKDEYVVQVSYGPMVIGEQVAERSEEIRKIKEEMTAKSPGMAYMYKQKLEKAVKAEVERLEGEWFKDFYGRISKHTDDIVVEKTKRVEKDKVMLLNLSCLVTKEKVGSLGEELERINNREGFSVHFSGPWPPYSFVAKPVVPAKDGMK